MAWCVIRVWPSRQDRLNECHENFLVTRISKLAQLGLCIATKFISHSQIILFGRPCFRVIEVLSSQVNLGSFKQQQTYFSGFHRDRVSNERPPPISSQRTSGNRKSQRDLQWLLASCNKMQSIFLYTIRRIGHYCTPLHTLLYPLAYITVPPCIYVENLKMTIHLQAIIRPHFSMSSFDSKLFSFDS